MAELVFDIVGARPEAYAAVPTLVFGLRIAETTGVRLHSLLLRCQVRIEPQRRTYRADEEERLLELFGETPRWGHTVKPFLWTHVTTTVQRFSGSTDVELHVPASYELEVAAPKYLHALGDGDIPLLFLFSGTIFGQGPAGLSVEQIAWHKEASFRLPVRVWRALMDAYYPDSGWLRLQRETLDALGQFKARNALLTWDETMAALLKAST